MIDVNRNPDGPEELRRLLEKANAALRGDQELAEARLEGLNRQLRELHRTGLVGAVVVPGPVILTRPYNNPAAESDQILQAALVLPAGVGVLVWDTFEIIEVEADPRLFCQEAARRHTPFEGCEPAVKALLSPTRRAWSTTCWR